MDSETALAHFHVLDRALGDGLDLPPLVAAAVTDMLIGYSADLGPDEPLATAGPAFAAWFRRHWRGSGLFAAEPNDVCLASRGVWTLGHEACRAVALKGLGEAAHG